VRNIFLAPSSIAYLFDDCLACFWRKCQGLKNPNLWETQDYHIGNAFDKYVKECFMAKQTEVLGIPHELTDCDFEKKWLLSEPIQYPEYGIQFQIRGALDKLFSTPRDTYVVIDAKVTKSNEKKFFFQLMSYAYALMKPASGESLEVEAIGCLYWDAHEGKFDFQKEIGVLTAPIAYKEVEMDFVKFMEKLDLIAKIAGQQVMPLSNEFCQFCKAVERAVLFDNSRQGNGGE
jgi:hypothetical protein